MRNTTVATTERSTGSLWGGTRELQDASTSSSGAHGAFEFFRLEKKKEIKH